MADDLPPLTIVIPLGGIGLRFTSEGYTARPKPFVNALGKPMLRWIIEALAIGDKDEVVIVYNPAFANLRVCMETEFGSECRFHLVELPRETRGAAETVLLGLAQLPIELRGRPVMLCDGDTFTTANDVARYRAVAAKSHNAIFCFRDTQPNPIYSYVTVDRHGLVTEIREKVKISDLANSGCYCFADGTNLERFCAMAVSSMEGSKQVGELYTSGVIHAMLAEGHPFEAIEITSRQICCLGTPEQLMRFCLDWVPLPKLKFLFDLESMVTHTKSQQNVSVPQPMPHVLEFLRALKEQGHIVNILVHNDAILTQRLQQGSPNGTAVSAWLRSHGVPFDEVECNAKYDFYVGTNAIDPLVGGDAFSLAMQAGVYGADIVSNWRPRRQARAKGAAEIQIVRNPSWLWSAVAPQEEQWRSGFACGMLAATALGFALAAPLAWMYRR